MGNVLPENLELEDVPPSVGYLKDPDGIYTLYTISREAVEALARRNVEFRYDQTQKHYEAEVAVLPRVKGIDFYEHIVKAPNEAKVKRLKEKYDKYLKMRAVVDKMNRQLDKLEDDMIDILVDHGIKLKPGSPEDAQLLIKEKKIRLHHQQSMTKSVDKEAIEELSKTHPALKDCLTEVTRVVVDKVMLESVIQELPAEDVDRIINLSPSFSFVETPLKRPGCQHCGGQILKNTGTCKRCNL